MTTKKPSTRKQITITKDQAVWLADHPHIKLSAWIRDCLDKKIKEHDHR